MHSSITLDSLTRACSALSRELEGGRIGCVACAHHCKLDDGSRGICKVRYRESGSLWVPWGYTAGLAADPIEKKPFFHVMPGSKALSFGMLGCDLQCSFCQNWMSSQSIRDPAASTGVQSVSAHEIVDAAKSHRCEVLVSTYNEPLITAEWAHSVFTEGKRHGLVTGFVSNGHATPEVLRFLRPVMDLLKVDLKAFREDSYRTLGGKLTAVKSTIADAFDLGYWVEVVTLLVPGFNDSEEELAGIAQFLVGISPEIPWHVTAFHPDYKMNDRVRTPGDSLIRAREIGTQTGLRFVYVGNLLGGTSGSENTYCPQCSAVLVRRVGFSVLERSIGFDGNCQGCGATIPGLWHHDSRLNRAVSRGEGASAKESQKDEVG
ncbi:MAG: AmmeMemoRadiSam system radical SAM enzyme [bacterium]|nr:AmmeMemoRadiSam system radical SAM enzyme [bacterium]